VFWGEAAKRDPAGHRANMGLVLDWVTQGKLKPRVHALYRLDEVGEAIRVLDQRQATGKVIISLD
jgi:NADPH:quinone reductase